VKRLRLSVPVFHNDNRRSILMRRFSPRLFVLGFVLGAIGTAAILAANAYAIP
jgi:hypothetical protein